MKNNHPHLTKSRLTQILEKFPGIRIGVLGDFFLDYYLVLDKRINEVSLETGLEAYQVSAVRKSPGAAGTVASILRSLGCQVKVVGFVGEDGNGFDLCHGLERVGVDCKSLLFFNDRFTPTYMKPMLLEDGYESEMSRIDIKNRSKLSNEQEDLIIEGLKDIIEKVDGIIILDQVREKNCGVVTDRILKEVENSTMMHPTKIYMADSRDHGYRFKKVILKCNSEEAWKSLNRNRRLKRDIEICSVGSALSKKTGKPVFITLGESGIICVVENTEILIPAVKVNGPIDVVGAGDSVMASITASLCAGANFAEAASIGMVTASIIIQQIGTTGIATRDQIIQKYIDKFKI